MFIAINVHTIVGLVEMESLPESNLQVLRKIEINFQKRMPPENFLAVYLQMVSSHWLVGTKCPCPYLLSTLSFREFALNRPWLYEICPPEWCYPFRWIGYKTPAELSCDTISNHYWPSYAYFPLFSGIPIVIIYRSNYHLDSKLFRRTNLLCTCLSIRHKCVQSTKRISMLVFQIRD